jgi:hypothetical protein
VPELNRLALAKLGFVLAGIGTFGVGIRIEDARVRWAGIVLVAVAWLLRLAGPRPGREPDAPQPPEETR